MTRTLLKVLAEARHIRGIEQFQRAYDRSAAEIDPRWVGSGPSREQFERWLAGRVKTKPLERHCLVLERMFPGRSITELLSMYAPETEVTTESAPVGRGRTEEDATNRRELFALGGGVGTGLVLTKLRDEPGRMQTTLDTGTVSAQRMAALEETAEDLAVRVVMVPPASLLAETFQAFRSVRKLLKYRQRTADQVRLIRTGAKLATVMGEILFNEGEFGLASEWYTTARRAAEDIGDRYVSDIALAGQAYLPTYSGDPHGVLALVDPRVESGHPTPSPAVAWLWGAKARAHAALGERIAFRYSLDRSRQALAASPAELSKPGIFSFVPEKLAFYEATGYVKLRDVEGATTTADEALALYDPTETTEPALVRLEKASAAAQIGDITEACRIAVGAVLDEHTYHSASVRRRADEFDRLIGRKNTAQPAVEWRDVLHAVTSRPKAALTTGSV